jgi:Hydrogenase maturation factor
MNIVPFVPRRLRGKVYVPTVTLAHGGGGKAMKDLIDDVFLEAFDNPLLAPLDDQARLDLAVFARHGDRLAFTTDSFVVDPLFFRAATSESWPSAEPSMTSRSAERFRSIFPAPSSSRKG